MARTILGYFRDEPAASAAYDELLAQGFSKDRISVLRQGSDERGTPDGADEHVTGAQGAALGGIAGLVVGVATMLIPGIGPLVAVGPLAAGLAGAVTGGVTGTAVGGLAGALIHAGVSEPEARHYEDRLSAGGVLLAVHTESGPEAAAARSVLQRHGGEVTTEDAAAADGRVSAADTDRAAAPAPARAGSLWDQAMPRYRADWEERTGGRGGRWEDVEPAYRFLWEQQSAPEYRGRAWNDVEPDLRRAWAARHPDRPWDRLALLLQHSWDTAPADATQRLALRSEQLFPEKEVRQIGEVRVRTEVEDVPQRAQAEVVREELRLHHVPVNEVVQDRIAPWEEDGTYVVPVYEEQVVLVKQLVLREYLRVERVPTTELRQFEDTVRRERVVVDDPDHVGHVREAPVAPADGAARRAPAAGRRGR